MLLISLSVWEDGVVLGYAGGKLHRRHSISELYDVVRCYTA